MGLEKNPSMTDSTVKFVNDIYDAMNIGQLTKQSAV